MNPVFWILVILAFVTIWFALVPYFKRIGTFLLIKFYRAKKEMSTKKFESEDLL